MLAPVNLLLITALAALIGLCVLGSLWRSGLPGIREAMAANVVTIVAMLLLAQQDSLPPWLGILLPNTLFAAGGSLFVVAVRRFLEQPVYWRSMLTAIGALLLALVYYTYIDWNVDRRIALASALYAVLLGGIVVSVWRSRRHRFGYSQGFMLCLALLATIGHVTRAVLYTWWIDFTPGLLAPTYWNIVFLSLGVVIMPSLTLGMIMMLHDRMLREREREANTDFLTGVLSRKAWWGAASRLAAGARGRPIAVLLLDIDHFKRVNDRLGHAAGDVVLRHFAAVAGAALRPGDPLGRLGGEEFIAALPGASMDEAQALATRMLAALRAMPCQFGDHPVGYTFSGGVTVWDGTEPLHNAMERADRAMYQAKKNGRSRVELCA
ncbi:GGDEF domain-containing protein [Bordetella avium]|uniref:GGDEF domain-containing protein n=1 Tax=Bordetella avium TaxID=521 RepID=UPI001600B14C|nr:GGDEF domain-containing protein [Bordetella avium]